MRKVRVSLGSNAYNIFIAPGLLKECGSILRESGFSGKVVVVTDPTVKSRYGDALNESLAAGGFKVAFLDVPEGEEQKSLERAARLYNELTNLYAERTTPLMALGGGVIGDLTGFVAATYLRGVPLVQVPTTLLAQVDSSIGGKVAVNHGSLKNKIGAFYQPRLVVADVNTLESLPAGELSDGLAEVIKYGVIADEDFFVYLERNLERIKSLDVRALETIVYRSARIKARIVAKDERDFSLRITLNYGHTVGHAVETVSGFSVGHGQAVAIGMVAAARISNRLGLLDKSEVVRLKNLLTRAGLPTELPGLEQARLIQAMKHDKKILQGKVRFVLPRAIGEVFITDEVSPSVIESVLVESHEEA